MLYQPENNKECFTILCKDCLLKNPKNCLNNNMRISTLKEGV